MDSDTLLSLAIIVTGFLWEHRAGIVALLALAFLGMIVNNIAALTQELHAVHETLDSIAKKLTEEDDNDS